MAGRLETTLTEYQALEAGELNISFDLYERIAEPMRVAALAAFPKGAAASKGSVTRSQTWHRSRPLGMELLSDRATRGTL